MKIIIDIGGREAIPVRAIPLATDWETMWPDELADSFASGIAMTAYRVEDGAVKKISLRWWKNETCRKLAALLASVQAAQSTGAITEEEGALRWRNESLPLLPAGAFVWRDEFEPFHFARHGSDNLHTLSQPYSPEVGPDEDTSLLDEEHDESVALDLEPSVSLSDQATIMEGFDLDAASAASRRVARSTPTAATRIQQFLDRANDPDSNAMLTAAEETTETGARRVLRGDLVEMAGPPLSPDTLQAVIDSGEQRDEPGNARPRGSEEDEESVRSHATASVRARAIRPEIEAAIEECKDPSNTAEVWNVLRRRCLEERGPFTGVISADGHLQYMETNTPKWLRRSNLPRMLR